jgi:hypothetical protein
MEQLQAVRSGRWKYHLPLPDKRTGWHGEPFAFPGALYDLESDPGELHDVLNEHPGIAERLARLCEWARRELGDGTDTGRGQRKAGFVENPVPLMMPPPRR